MPDFAKQNELALLKQKANVENLLKLIRQNPDLPIIPLVRSEVVCDDCYSWWCGSLDEARLDEIITNFDDSILCKHADSYEGLYEDIFGYDDDFNENATEEEIKAKIDALPWMKCIVVFIDTREFEIPERRT